MNQSISQSMYRSIDQSIIYYGAPIQPSGAPNNKVS